MCFFSGTETCYQVSESRWRIHHEINYFQMIKPLVPSTPCYNTNIKYVDFLTRALKNFYCANKNPRKIA